MKKILLALVALSAFSNAVMAQSSVTVYGAIDVSLMYKTNVDAAGNHMVSMGNSPAIGDGGQGALSGSRIGFKGDEDLGGGSKALFVLEAGLTLNNGASDQQGQLFGRQAYVGLSNKDYGTLTLGRQYGVGATFAGNFDPLEIGNNAQNEWEAFLLGIRFDNTLMYSKAFGGLGLNVQHSFGEQSGNSAVGSTNGLNLKYADGPISVGGLFQQSQDARTNKMTALGLGATYAVGPATLFGTYYNIKFDPGFSIAASRSGGALANTTMLVDNSANVTKRTDSVWVLGGIYNFTAATNLTVGYMHDSIKNVSAVGGGSMSTLYAVLDHALSKRTDVYLSTNYTQAGGQLLFNGTTLNGIGSGKSNSIDVALGLRHRF
jgi:predicted porin